VACMTGFRVCMGFLHRYDVSVAVSIGEDAAPRVGASEPSSDATQPPTGR